jgi:hypothetical protein
VAARGAERVRARVEALDGAVGEPHARELAVAGDDRRPVVEGQPSSTAATSGLPPSGPAVVDARRSIASRSSIAALGAAPSPTDPSAAASSASASSFASRSSGGACSGLHVAPASNVATVPRRSAVAIARQPSAATYEPTLGDVGHGPRGSSTPRTPSMARHTSCSVCR